MSSSTNVKPYTTQVNASLWQVFCRWKDFVVRILLSVNLYTQHKISDSSVTEHLCLLPPHLQLERLLRLWSYGNDGCCLRPELVLPASWSERTGEEKYVSNHGNFIQLFSPVQTKYGYMSFSNPLCSPQVCCSLQNDTCPDTNAVRADRPFWSFFIRLRWTGIARCFSHFRPHCSPIWEQTKQFAFFFSLFFCIHGPTQGQDLKISSRLRLTMWRLWWSPIVQVPEQRSCWDQHHHIPIEEKVFRHWIVFPLQPTLVQRWEAWRYMGSSCQTDETK